MKKTPKPPAGGELVELRPLSRAPGRPSNADKADRAARAAEHAAADLAAVERLAVDFARESTLKAPEARARLARALAHDIVRHERLVRLDLSGLVSPDVAKTLPGLSRSIMKLSIELGLTAKRARGAGFMDGDPWPVDEGSKRAPKKRPRKASRRAPEALEVTEP